MKKETPDAQTRASQKWNKNNREHRTYLSVRSGAKTFIRNKATLEDLEDLEKLIEERKKELQK